jgi:hypothetical protein
MISRHGIFIQTLQNIIRTAKTGARSCCQGKILKVLYVKIMAVMVSFMERVNMEGEPLQSERPYGVDPNRLYPIEFVADLLSVDRKLVRWWIKKGVLEGIRLPNRAWRIRGIEIIRLIDQGKNVPKG